MKVIHATDLNTDSNWRAIIYGRPGIGKTTSIKNLEGKTMVISLDNSHKVIKDFPNVDVWIDPDIPNNDDGEASFDRKRPNDSIVNFLGDLQEISKKYDNLVFDNISSFEKDWFVEKGRESKNGISNEIQDYSQWSNYFTRIMTSLYSISNINIVTTAWETQTKITSESGQEFMQYAPNIRDAVRDGLLGLADVVGRMIVNPSTGKRGVILEGNDSVYAKNRMDNRKACAIEDLFKWGDVNVSTPSIPDQTGKPGKAETPTGK